MEKRTPGPSGVRRLRSVVGSILLFAALTGALLEFRPRYFSTHLPADLGDPVLVLYFLEWGGKSIGEGLDHFWDANFYFPAKRVMTLSDHLLGPALEAKAFRLFWDDGVASYNFLFLGSFVLSGLTTAWVLRQSGASAAAAVLAGILFAFSPYRFDQRSHLQVLLMQWIPLVLWHWDRLLASPDWRRAAPFAAFYLLHVTGGNYLAYFIHFALAIFLLQHWRQWRVLLSARSLRVLVPVGVVCAAATVAIFAPYLAARSQLGLVRSPGDIEHYGATVSSWLTIESHNALWGGLARGRGRSENHLFAGFLTTGFAIAGVVSAARSWRRGRAPLGSWERGVLATGIFFFLLSFPWLYLPLARIVPGLLTMRVPTRVYPFVSFALVVLAARGIDGLLGLARGRRRALLAVVVGAMMVIELRSHLPWRQWPRQDDLGIFREMARLPEVRAVLDLPVVDDAREAQYMYYSTLHWKPIANGYSGFAPPTYVELRRRLREEPLEDATIDYLLTLGITHVGAHSRLLRAPRARRELKRWERRFTSGPRPRIRLVAAVGDDRLYQLLP